MNPMPGSLRSARTMEKDTGEWMRAFSEILRSPPEVEILRVDEMQTSSSVL
jgi:hypothetical protein